MIQNYCRLVLNCSKKVCFGTKLGVDVDQENRCDSENRVLFLPLEKMNIGQMFFGQLTFNGNLAVYNGLTFERNEKGTHFDATSIMEQCRVIQELTRDTKKWAHFMRGKVGRIPEKSYYETKNGRRLVKWVEYERLLPILTYSLGDGNTVNEYLSDKDWIDTSGFVYLVRTVINGEVIMKYGHSWNVDQRMISYKHMCDEYELIAWCPVEKMIKTEEKIGEYLHTHGAVQHERGNEWFTFGKVVGNADCYKAFDEWLMGIDAMDPSLVEGVVSPKYIE